jgi:hypothetical protein
MRLIRVVTLLELEQSRDQQKMVVCLVNSMRKHFAPAADTSLAIHIYESRQCLEFVMNLSGTGPFGNER